MFWEKEIKRVKFLYDSELFGLCSTFFVRVLQAKKKDLCIKRIFMALTSWKLYLDTHIFLVDAVDVIVYLAI
jgi:hypothetical protein